MSEARDVLWRLDGSSSEKERTISVDIQLSEITDAINLERKDGNGGFRTCFKMGNQRYFHRVLLGMGSQFMQQISGINLIAYYARESIDDVPINRRADGARLQPSSSRILSD